MRIGTWKRSQRSNGYYNIGNSTHRLPQLIHFESTEGYGDMSDIRYTVYIKRGLGDSPNSVISYQKSLEGAKKFMIEFMKKYPKGVSD